MTPASSFVTHLESAIEPGVLLPHHVPQTLHAGRPLWVRYDLTAVASAMRKDSLLARAPTMWRYRELLPVEDDANIVTLGEGMSPLLDCPALARRFGLEHLSIKDESQLPTGSFKSRGLSVAVSRAKELGLTRLAIPTAGNAGGALAAYCARAGLEAFVFMPEDTPEVNRCEAALFGAKVFLVNGLIDDCAAIVRAGVERMGWFDMSTLKEPYRIEGKKTMGLELAEQMDWSLPDAILYPTGGGTGLIGMWKAFAELEAIGWLERGAGKPRMYSCQSSGCAPIARAFAAGERHASRFENAATIASGLRVPAAVGDFMILDAVRESGGEARAADESGLVELMSEACRLTGISICPETAVCLGVLKQLVAEGKVRPEERIVIFNTGAAQKYIEVMRNVEVPRIDRNEEIDWARLR